MDSDTARQEQAHDRMLLAAKWVAWSRPEDLPTWRRFEDARREFSTIRDSSRRRENRS